MISTITIPTPLPTFRLTARLSSYERIDTSDLTEAESIWLLSADGQLTVDGITVQAVPAYNRADGEHVDDDGMSFACTGW